LTAPCCNVLGYPEILNFNNAKKTFDQIQLQKLRVTVGIARKNCQLPQLNVKSKSRADINN
jgi:hypothetical protein